jgi:hypothetical protein
LSQAAQLMNNSPMGMIRDFIRSLTEQRTYPYY